MIHFPLLRFTRALALILITWLLADSRCLAATLSWQPSPSSGPAPNLINGSFESDFTGWTGSGNRFIRSTVSTQGTKAASFNGNGVSDSAPNGTLTQVFATTPGYTYVVAYDSGTNGAAAGEQKLQVTATGNGSLLSQVISVTHPGGSTAQWVPKLHTFVADSASTTLTFRDISTVTDGLDMLLDNVRVFTPYSPVVGYRVRYGTAPGIYTTTLEVGPVTSATIPDPPTGTSYYCVVTACTTASIESLPSAEIIITGAGNPPSGNADLSSLAVSAGTLSPAFASGTLAYTASVAESVGSITITPTVAQANATVTVNGTNVPSGAPSAAVNLATGTNIITTVVTAQNGTTTKTYRITVTRAASNNANLASLIPTVGTLAPSFNSNTTSYSANVPYATTAIMLTPTVAQANATVKVNGANVPSGMASQSISIGVGSSTITLLVTAPDRVTTKTYSVLINRAKSSNANLAALILGGSTLSPSFTSGTTSYTASVPDTTTSVTVTPTAADTGATIKVNSFTVPSGVASPGVTLATGSNAINIVVAAPDGTTKTYTITVSQIPVTNIAGNYNGLATPAVSASDPARHVGLGVVTVNATGAFTGKVTLGGSSTALAFSGTFGSGGTGIFGPNTAVALSVPRTGLPTLSLVLNIDRRTPVASQISGTLADPGGAIVSSLVLDRGFYSNATNPAPPLMTVPIALLNPETDKGAYTAVFQPRTPAQLGIPSTNFPQGHGWATMKLQSNGTVAVSGKLGDGQAFSYSAYLSRTNVLPLYLKPYSGAGTVIGSLTFRDMPAQTDADGLGLKWYKPANARDTSYREGWPTGIEVDFLGSKYVSPVLTKKTPLGIDPATPPTTNAWTMLTEGGLVNPLCNTLAVGTASRATVLGAPTGMVPAANLAITISPSGMFSGSFLHPTWNTTPTLGGVVLQKTQTAGGFFLTKRNSNSALQSGAATISTTNSPASIAAN